MPRQLDPDLVRRLQQLRRLLRRRKKRPRNHPAPDAAPPPGPTWEPDNPRPDNPHMCRCGATAADPYCFCGC